MLAHLEWFEKELREIQQSGRIDLTVFITRQSPDPQDSLSKENGIQHDGSEISPHYTFCRMEKGKPDVGAVLDHTIKAAKRTDKIIVTVCGPESLMRTVRNLVAKAIPLSGPSLTLRSEQFGW